MRPKGGDTTIVVGETDWSASLICTRLRLEDSMNASRQHQDEEVPHL